jgi:hypothetical protein
MEEPLDYWKLFTVLVAIFVACVSFQQYRINREKFKLDLFEKRFAVFAATRKLLSIVLRDAKAELKNLFEYRAAVAEATFLFDDEITNYLNEIDKQFLRLHTTDEELKEIPIGEERHRKVDENAKILEWLTDQLPELKKQFSPYLKFRVWK